MLAPSHGVWRKRELKKKEKEGKKLKRANERMSDQTKEIEIGGSAQRFMHKYSHSLAHTHWILNRRAMCNGSGNISSFFFLFLFSTFIRGWNGHVASLDGNRVCTQLSLTVKILISPHQRYRSLGAQMRQSLNSLFEFILFSFLFRIFVNLFNWSGNGRSIAAHTSAQFYSNFSSKRVEKCVRIFYMHRFLSQLKAIQWGHIRRQQQQQQMVTRHRRETQTHKSKGFWPRWCVRTSQYQSIPSVRLACGICVPFKCVGALIDLYLGRQT